jgi:hypothetical protein
MSDKEPPNDESAADLDAALQIIKDTRGRRFVDRFIELGLDPRTDFAGGDWRNCDFSNSDLGGCDFRNSRLFFANFKHALLDDADFRGAGDVHTANIHLAYGWRNAKFDEYQFVLIEAQIEKLNELNQKNERLRREMMSEKDWFFAIKACNSFFEAEILLKQMEKAGYGLNPFAYSSVLDRAKRDHMLRQGWNLFNSFIKRGGEPDEALYTAGIGVAPDSQTALEVFNYMKTKLPADEGPVGERAYNMVISKQRASFTIALGLFHDMKRNRITPSRFTVYALFDACQSFANAVTVLMEANKSNIDIDDYSFLEELKNTTRYPDLHGQNIEIWLNDGLSNREFIIKLVNIILHDPFRRDALATLASR